MFGEKSWSRIYSTSEKSHLLSSHGNTSLLLFTFQGEIGKVGSQNTVVLAFIGGPSHNNENHRYTLLKTPSCLSPDGPLNPTAWRGILILRLEHAGAH